LDRDLVDRQLAPLGQEQQLCVEEPRVVLDVGEQPLDELAPAGLEPALGVGEPDPEGGCQQQVVGARDDLALEPPLDLRSG
jgi:hypothetical protein